MNILEALQYLEKNPSTILYTPYSKDSIKSYMGIDERTSTFKTGINSEQLEYGLEVSDIREDWRVFDGKKS